MSAFFSKSALAENFNFTSEIKEGLGYSSLFAKPMNKVCIGKLYRPGNALGQKVYLNMQVVENIYEYEKVQRSSFKASGSYGPFGGGGSTSFINNLQINSYSCYLIASVTIINPIQFLEEIRLTPNAQKLLEQEDKFYARYGDNYINGLIKGGELFIAYEFKSKNKIEQRDISAKLNASASLFNAKAEAKYAESIKKLEKYSREQIAFYTSSHKQGTPLPNLELGDLMEYAKQYTTQVDNDKNNSVLGYEVKSLSKIENLIDIPSIINSKELFDQIKKKEHFEDMLENFYDWSRDIQYVSAFEEQFTDEAINKAKEDDTLVNDKIDRIKTLLDQAYFTEDFSDFDNLRAKDFECNPEVYLRKVAKPPAKQKYHYTRRRRLVIRTPFFKISF